MTSTTDAAHPEVGGDVTMHERGGHSPGTILEVAASGDRFSFRLDRSEWVHRAVRQADGTYREVHDMWRLELGMRRSRPQQPAAGVRGQRRIAELEEAVDRIEPFLLKTRWHAMTCMAIPSVKANARALLAELAAFRDRDEEHRARAEALHGRLSALLAGFTRTH